MTAARRLPPYTRFGETRCLHDMLVFAGVSTCATCKGLPDVPPVDAEYSIDFEPDPTALLWGLSDRTQICKRCDSPIHAGKPVAYSPEEHGPVGTCCETLR